LKIKFEARKRFYDLMIFFYMIPTIIILALYRHLSSLQLDQMNELNEAITHKPNYYCSGLIPTHIQVVRVVRLHEPNNCLLGLISTQIQVVRVVRLHEPNHCCLGLMPTQIQVVRVLRFLWTKSLLFGPNTYTDSSS